MNIQKTNEPLYKKNNLRAKIQKKKIQKEFYIYVCDILIILQPNLNIKGILTKHMKLFFIQLQSQLQF